MLTVPLVRIELEMPDETVTLTEKLFLNVHIKKRALAIQNRATIDIGGMTQKMREYLLSNFTAFNKRLRETGRLEAKYINVTIRLGYLVDGKETLSVVFKGQVVTCEPVSGPPDMVVRLNCYTRQIDKTKFITSGAPDEVTFAEYVKWAAEQMGFGSNYICDTSINNEIIHNPGRTAFVAAALLADIQSLYRDSVAAYVDDDFLYVKDKDKILNPNEIVELNEFTQPPTWNEWGVDFQVMFNPNVKLAQGARLTSIINPSLNGTTFVVMEVQYDAASRADNFTVTVAASPAGSYQ